jgi:drug/metabolite transporter (DMT)-like permease
MPLGILLGLTAAAAYGVSDFLGGAESRRLPALSVALWSQVTGSFLLAVAILLVAPHVNWTGAWWGLASGAVGGAAIMVFYRALAVGSMSIVAPISASGAIIPVVVSLIRGDVPSTLALVGMGLSLAGILVVSRATGTRETPAGPAGRGLLLALASGVGFGSFFVLVNQGLALPNASPLWVLAAARVGSLLTLFLLSRLGRLSAQWPARRALPVAIVGVLDTLATVALIYALTRGNLGVVAVLSAQYPVLTVVMARVILRERLTGTQLIGVVLALGGISLIAAG